MPVAAPADRRFRRARVPPRRSRWLTFTWSRTAGAAAVIALVLFGVHHAYSLLLDAQVLTIRRFDVRGNSRMSSGEVVAVIGGLRGTNIATADLEPWRQALLRSPWVAEAALRRVLPGTITVAISERQPMGIGRVGDGLYLVDDRGGIIDQFGPNYAEIDLPIIDGLATAPRDNGPLIDGPRAGLAARVLASLQTRPSLARRVSEIDVSDARDAVLLLEGDTTLVRLGDGQFAERLQSYLDLAPALRERIPSIDYVDLRFDERVYVRPRGSESPPQPVSGNRRQED